MPITLIEVFSPTIPDATNATVVVTAASWPSDNDLEELAKNRDPSLPPFDLEQPIYYHVTGLVRPNQRMVFRILIYQL